jgi:hypothetical protein
MKKYTIALFLVFAAVAITVSAQKKTAELVKLDEGQNFLILSTKRIQTMEKELDEVAAKGFRVLYGAPTISYDMALFLEKLENPERPFSYKILATSRNKTMEKELNEQASKGFRLLPRTMIFKQGLFTAEVVSVMERGFGDGRDGLRAELGETPGNDDERVRVGAEGPADVPAALAVGLFGDGAGVDDGDFRRLAEADDVEVALLEGPRKGARLRVV